jgi:hypothetical protein
LNAQELSNSVYRGSFNELLHELTRTPNFRAMIGTKVPRRRGVDEELILRFFSLHERLGIYRTPLKRFLNDFMGSVRNAGEGDIALMRAKFQETTGVVHQLIGQAAFRITDRTGEPIEPAVNWALFDAQMLACSWVTTDLADINTRDVRRAVAGFYSLTNCLWTRSSEQQAIEQGRSSGLGKRYRRWRKPELRCRSHLIWHDKYKCPPKRFEPSKPHWARYWICARSLDHPWPGHLCAWHARPEEPKLSYFPRISSGICTRSMKRQ